MTQNEKDRLLSMFLPAVRWCKEMEACDGSGQSVHFDDPAAVAWDLTGGLCFLFGWERAGILFPQLERHILDDRRSARAGNASIASMVALQEFNDRPETTHQRLLECIRTMPVWAHGPLGSPSASDEKECPKEMSDVQCD